MPHRSEIAEIEVERVRRLVLAIHEATAVPSLDERARRQCGQILTPGVAKPRLALSTSHPPLRLIHHRDDDEAALMR